MYFDKDSLYRKRILVELYNYIYFLLNLNCLTHQQNLGHDYIILGLFLQCLLLFEQPQLHIHDPIVKTTSMACQTHITKSRVETLADTTASFLMSVFIYPDYKK